MQNIQTLIHKYAQIYNEENKDELREVKEYIRGRWDYIFI